MHSTTTFLDINNTNEPEVAQHKKGERLRQRLGEKFGWQYVGKGYTLSPHWRVHYTFTDTGGIRCWCTTHIQHCYVLSHALVPDVRVGIGSTCFQLFKNNVALTLNAKKQRDVSTTERRKRKALEDGRVCTHCRSPLYKKPVKLEFCSTKCEAIGNWYADTARNHC
jgi:hypothetical protein